MLLDLLKVQKWYLTCVSSYNWVPIFRPGLLEGPKSALEVDGNLKSPIIIKKVVLFRSESLKVQDRHQ